jgi:hypothetical protein
MTQPGGGRGPRVGPVVVVLLATVVVSLATTSGSGRAAPLAPAPVSWTVAGTGVAGDAGDGGQAREAEVNLPRSVSVTADGGVVWGEPWSNRIRKVWPDGHVSTIAGTGVAGFSGDGGPAVDARLNFVHAAAPTSDGGYVLADTMNCRIRRISPGGIITTVAGDGSCGYAGDGGPATDAEINNPRSVVALPDGGFLFPDSNNHRVRRVRPDGTITTVAGTGVQGFSGDGGPATSAELSIPFGVSPTADGGFLVVDVGNQRIRKVASDGTITTVAGNGVAGYSGDGGPATSAELNNPHYVLALSDGSFLIADASNNRVRLVSAAGTISTFEGDGNRGFAGDGGPVAAAEISVPKGLAVTPSGDVLIADEQNNRIRFAGALVAPANVSPPALAGTPTEGMTLRASPGAWSGTGPAFSYQWQRCNTGGASCVDIGGATAKAYALVAADQGATLRVRVTAANAAGSVALASSPTSVVGAPLVAPANVTPPSISGSPQPGQTLNAIDGTWSGTAPMTFTRQWQRCDGSGSGCADIAGATAATYLVTGADLGATLRVVVTAANAAGPSTYPAVVTADVPTAYWRLDDTGAAVADQRGFADGVYVGSRLSAPGLLAAGTDAAASLDGTSRYVEVAPNAVWTASPFSLEILVKPSALPDNRTIAAAQTDSLNGWWLNTDSAGALRFFIGDGAGWRFAAAGPTLAAGAAYDIVATYDGSVARLYVNGALVSTGPTVTMASDIGTSPLRFGSASSFVGQLWAGAIDEASFYSSVLTPSEIARHHAAMESVPVATSGAIAVVAAAASAGGSGGGGAPPSPPPASPPPPPPAPAPQVVAPGNHGLPLIAGRPTVGVQLTATTGKWTGTAPISYRYRWLRCRRSCVTVGPNRRAYRLSRADLGARIQVVVSATNVAGSASATSTATKAVQRVKPLVVPKPRRSAR